MAGTDKERVIYTVALDATATPEIAFRHLTDLSRWWIEEYIGEPLKLNTEFMLRADPRPRFHEQSN